MAFSLKRELRHDIVSKGLTSWVCWEVRLQREADKLAGLRDQVLAGAGAVEFALDEGETFADVQRYLMGLQGQDGRFSLIIEAEDGRFEEDRDDVDFVYRPTYACCQILARALLDGCAVEGAWEALARGLAFSAERELVGWADDPTVARAQQCADLLDFGRCGISELLERHPGLCPAFGEVVAALLEELAGGADALFGDVDLLMDDVCDGLPGVSAADILEAWSFESSSAVAGNGGFEEVATAWKVYDWRGRGFSGGITRSAA